MEKSSRTPLILTLGTATLLLALLIAASYMGFFPVGTGD